jgi:hypothetical protein
MIALIITLAANQSANGQGIVMHSYIGLGPAVRTQSFVNDVTYALRNNLSSYGSWKELPDGDPLCVTNVFYSGDSGGRIYVVLSATNSSPFTLAQIGYLINSPIFSFSGTFGGDGRTYDTFGIGISNNVVYTSGNANTPVMAVYVVGYGSGIDISGTTVNDESNTWTHLTPMAITTTYYLSTTNTTSQVVLVTSPTIPISLQIRATNGNSLVVSWPNSQQFTNLQQSCDLTGTNWTAVTNAQNVVGNDIQVIVPKTISHFYRLKYP